VHYSIVQRLMKLQKSLLNCFPTKSTSSSLSINKSDDGTITDTTVSTPREHPAAPTRLLSLLWLMSYAFGFGMNVPASKWATQLLSVGVGGGLNSNTNSLSDTITMLLTILEYYNNNEEDGEEDTTTMTMTATMKMEIDCAMTAWLSVSCSSLSSSIAYSSLTGDNNINLQNDMNRQVQNNSYSLLFQLSARLLLSNYDNNHADDDNNDGFDSLHYIALRAIEVGQLESHKSKQGESILEDSEAEAITELIKVFSSQWKSTSSTSNITTTTMTTMMHSSTPTSSTCNSSSNWNALPVFHSIMMNTLRTRQNLIAIGSRQCLNELAKCLYDPHKQYYAVQIFQTYAEAGRPLILLDDDNNDDDDNDDDDLINPKTLQRLDVWAKDLLQNEADELEDDIASVAHWVCKELMNDMESWHDNEIDDDDDDDDDNDDSNNNTIIACGRMLSWLSILNIADAATSKDSVNRLAFTSYVSRCKAVDAMMNLAINYGNVAGNSSDHHYRNRNRNRNQKVQLDVVIPMKDILQQQQYDSSSSSSSNYVSLSLSKLAARVIYRSVEVFPTLSKNWWDDSASGCPTYLTQTVKEFVETQVSPDILHHAVKSVKNAIAFGEMKVMGSSVSREVTATYVQDDFTLSVVIKLPLSYPFRRAEVDCSKTLGVPMSRWKRWSLQITQMLNNQGGTIKDALLLWKDNVDKEFEGIEPCPVCYSVLHVKSHKLPNMACKTCHNHFHSDCLFEWFKSSGKSACVICQQPWSGTRI